MNTMTALPTDEREKLADLARWFTAFRDWIKEEIRESRQTDLAPELGSPPEGVERVTFFSEELAHNLAGLELASAQLLALASPEPPSPVSYFDFAGRDGPRRSVGPDHLQLVK